MPNPYASTAGASTITATVSGNDNLNDFHDPRGGDRQREPMGVREVARRIFTYVRPHAGLFTASFACAALSVVLQLFVPILIGRAIDLIVGAGRVDLASLIPLLVQLAATVLAAAALQWVQGACVNRLSCATVRDLRTEAYDKLTRVPLSLIDRHPHGDYISRVVNDVDQVGDGLLQGLTQLFNGVVTIAATLVFMFTTSVPMAFLVVLVTPFAVLAAGAMARFAGRSFAAQMGIQGELSAYVEEYVGAQRLVSSFAYGDRAREGFAHINRELYTAGERAQFLSSLANPGTRFVNNCMYAVVAVAGFVGVVTGFPAVLTVGDVQVFLSYANQYTKPFNEISGVVTQVQGAFASARRVFALLDAPEDGAAEAPAAVSPIASRADDGTATDPTRGSAPRIELDAPAPGGASPAGPLAGDVVFDHVDFSYVPGHPLLQDICLHARPGMRMALVGPTGCGKTTLINLLLRFYDVDAGEIRVNGKPTTAYAREDLRRAFGMVLQESWLFEGSVHDNIAYGCPGASREQVEDAARRARADAFIRALPAGYDTVLPENGGLLSQGQRQLLCIARVMLADPEILLLDEATSSIDTRTELQVQAAFDNLMRGRTSFVVAHRLSTIREADCILVMRGGRIVERGTHDELLAAGGFYAELYNSQFATTC